MTPLIPESGVFIPTVALGAILDQSNKDPNNLFHKLVDHFFQSAYSRDMNCYISKNEQVVEEASRSKRCESH